MPPFTFQLLNADNRYMLPLGVNIILTIIQVIFVSSYSSEKSCNKYSVDFLKCNRNVI